MVLSQIRAWADSGEKPGCHTPLPLFDKKRDSLHNLGAGIRRRNNVRPGRYRCKLIPMQSPWSYSET